MGEKEINRADNIVKNFRIAKAISEIGFEYWLQGYVVFNRGGIIVELPLMKRYSIEEDSSDEDLILLINDYHKEAERLTYLWKMPKKEIKDLRGRIISATPIEIKDEEMSKDKYESHFNVIMYQ